MMAEISKKVELKFWDIMIPILSKAVWAQKSVAKLVSIYHNEKLTKQLATIVVIACGGFASGILVFSITNYLV